MSGHLGRRVSDLLDGQLPTDEADRAWTHIHGCGLCRQAVEREGWVKTQLVNLSMAGSRAPEHLKGSLLGSALTPSYPTDYAFEPEPERAWRGTLLTIGGGALGAAVLGIVALGVAPANAPAVDRRAPVTSIGDTVFGPPSRQVSREERNAIAPHPAPALAHH
jgi:hypothetical protein